MEGYIGLYRCLLEKPIWKQSTPEQKAILITILLMVNYRENEWEWMGEKFKIQPGQTITSLEKIAEAAGKGISIQNVRSALLRFEKLGFLTNQSTKTGRLITIDNWSLYQVELKQTNKDINKEVTKDQQRGNKEVTTNNKDNKDNKEKNILSEYTEDEELITAIKSFIEMRTKIKKPLTQNALKLILKKLDELASNDNEKILILNQSTLNCWQGIFELKEKPKVIDMQQNKKPRNIKFVEEG